jgi:hypothetical protein
MPVTEGQRANVFAQIDFFRLRMENEWWEQVDISLKKRFGLLVSKKTEKRRFGDMCHISGQQSVILTKDTCSFQFWAYDDRGHLTISFLDSRGPAQEPWEANHHFTNCQHQRGPAHGTLVKLISAL